jgi:hypothetical protein
MKYVCTIHTTGGPIAILPRDVLRLWDADKDYNFATSLPMDGSAAFVFNFKRASPLCIFRHSADENFHIYCDRSTVVILSEIYAERGYEIENQLPSLEAWVTKKAPVLVKSFGGKVAIFDATLPGAAIPLKDAGCVSCQCGTDDKRFDAAVIDVDFGNWEAVELYCRLPNISFTGIVFRREERITH